MAKVDLQNSVSGLSLSADEIALMTKWQDAMVNDYVSFQDTILLLAEGIDTVAIQSDAPATATSAGSAGQIAFDASYFYICVATDTWRRVGIAAW